MLKKKRKNLLQQPLLQIPLTLKFLLQTAGIHLQHGMLLLQIIQLRTDDSRKSCCNICSPQKVKYLLNGVEILTVSARLSALSFWSLRACCRARISALCSLTACSTAWRDSELRCSARSLGQKTIVDTSYLEF